MTTGIVTKKTAADLGLVGFVARASGIPSDRRVRFPFPHTTSSWSAKRPGRMET